MKLRTLLVFAVGVVGGIYISTKDKKNTSKKIKEYSPTLKPIINDLIKKSNNLLDDIVNLKSDELKANIQKRVVDLKDKISSIKTDDISNAGKSLIKETTKVLRKIRAEINLSPKVSSKRMVFERKTVTELRKIAKKIKVQLQPHDKKPTIIDKIIEKNK